MKGFDLKKSAGIALVLLIAMLAVNYVFTTYLGNAPQTFYSTVNIPGIGSVNVNVPQTYNPVSASVGTKLTAWITGVIPGIPDAGTLLVLYISALVIVLLGGLLIDWLNLPTFGGKVGRLATVMIVGSIIPYLYFVGAVMPTFGVMGFIGLAIYAFVAAWVAALVAGLLKIEI